ncbi:5-methylcytosine rRNA methyltransferase NSUN4 isoform X2 [Centruroides vittatus]|uniref:5-methylcytosine rRNA methyltransferase NSUN4 isoform X2 n=1 Tax=Centruroides vittatus TaxID=120091 RepID=UPI00351061A4
MFIVFKLRFPTRCFLTRGLSKKAKMKEKMKTTSIEQALQHFDDFYSGIFKTKWPSIRLALQCPSKYCAFVNTFSDVESTIKTLEEYGAINLNNIYNKNVQKCQKESNKQENKEIISSSGNINNPDEILAEETDDFIETDKKSVYSPEESYIAEGEYIPATKFKYEEEIIDENEYFSFLKSDLSLTINSEREKNTSFPKSWNIYIYPRGNIESFPAPKKDSLELFSYYLMDGASILPVLALNPQPGELIGDFCAAPGGKTLAILFSLQFGKLICNDVSKTRLNRLVSVLNQYIPSLNICNERVEITNLDARKVRDKSFDKILLDVPCTNDRLSVTDVDNNIFSSRRITERIKMPQLQMEILSAGLQSLRVGGSVVYSTCSLSPIQNDGVIHMALSHFHKNTNKEFIIKDLTDTFNPFNKAMKIWNCKYGKLILPFLPLNYGPMYICKITRIK